MTLDCFTAFLVVEMEMYCDVSGILNTYFTLIFSMNILNLIMKMYLKIKNDT